MFKKLILSVALVAGGLIAPVPASAQFNLSKAAKGLGKAVEAATLTDAQMSAYVKEYIDWMDKNNPVLPDSDPYVKRF